MFTGLIETQGKVIANQHGDVANRLLIRAPFESLQVGESIAVNGACLTLLPGFEKDLAFDISPETLKITTLGDLKAGDDVNLERAMLATSRFGGHFVSGHVDTTARLLAITVVGDYLEIKVGEFGILAKKYLLPKGSITLDGVNLTINEVKNGCINVMLVPHTLTVTTLGQLTVGQRVNVEFDYFARIVANHLEAFINEPIQNEVET